MIYVNYDKKERNLGTIHLKSCSHVTRALEESPARMKDVRNGYWLAVRRMEDALRVIRDLGANPHGCEDCRPQIVF